MLVDTGFGCFLTLVFMLKEMSVTEQRYRAVLAVIADVDPVRAVAERWGVSRQTVHALLARYEAGGLAALAPPADTGLDDVELGTFG